MTVRIGTRRSALAVAQAGLVAELLAQQGVPDTELVLLSSAGDRSTDPLPQIGGTGVFAGALRDSLRADECDLLVHSLKDLPVAAEPGLTVAAIPPRADARDVLCSRGRVPLADLPLGARVGTGSPRRAAQLLRVRPDIAVLELRGNVDTRLRAVTAGDLDAVVLAAAGLERLGRLDQVSEYLPLADWPTAPGQGALALEVRQDSAGQPPEPRLVAALKRLSDPFSAATVTAERAVLAGLEAGCTAPIGATASIEGFELRVSATVYGTGGGTSPEFSSGKMLTGADQAAFDPGLAGDLDRAVRQVSAAVVRILLSAGAGQLVGIGATG